MRVHQVVQCGDGFYLNRSSKDRPSHLVKAVMKLTQRRSESDEAFEERTVRAVRRRKIPHVTNLDGTN